MTEGVEVRMSQRGDAGTSVGEAVVTVPPPVLHTGAGPTAWWISADRKGVITRMIPGIFGVVALVGIVAAVATIFWLRLG